MIVKQLSSPTGNTGIITLAEPLVGIVKFPSKSNSTDWFASISVTTGPILLMLAKFIV